MDIIESRLVQGTALGRVLQAVPADAGTDGRGEPFAEVDIRSKTHLAKTILLLDDGVDTGAEADERVVESAVGQIRTTGDSTVGIPVVVLLGKSAEGGKKSCNSKDSK